MKTAFILIVLAGAENAFAAGCHADNCLRGVAGTAPGIEPPLSSRLEDCSSFLAITVTPAPSTTTYTTTVITTLPVGANKRGEIAARQVTVSPSNIPTYATYCPASSSYISACSCVGITRHTTTVPTPTVTKVVTATATVCPSAGETNCGGTCYDLSSSNNNCGACGYACPSGQSCSSGSCVPTDPNAPYKCNNPGVCDDTATCGRGCGLCHPDSTGQGYCVGEGTCAGVPLCSTNSDCSSGVCLQTCCGGGVCDNAVDNFCSATTAKNLFKSRLTRGGQNPN